MRKKILGFFICMLLIATVFPMVKSVDDRINLLFLQNTSTKLCLAGDWDEIQKLLPLDGAEEDFFGQSVSVDGDTALIGAYFDDHSKGSAYVYTRSGTTWTQQAKLVASDGAEGDWFGFSVSLDGDTALIGAYQDDATAEFCGSAYVFIRSGTTWTEQAKLLASDGEYLDAFAASVSLNGDTALIGTPGDDDKGSSSGSAYVFTQSGTSWTEQAKLLASDGSAQDYFGGLVSLDGDTALIGSSEDDDNGADSGSAYIFTRTGTAWTQQQKLIASDGTTGDYFGVSLTLDGDTAVIGACGDDVNGNWSGSAYIFFRTGDTWTQQIKLFPSDGAEGDNFANSISLDGDTLFIGAPGDDWKGSVYVFTRMGSSWKQQTKLFASDGAIEDWFGLAISIDGDTAFITAPRNDDNGDDSGSAYVFEKNNQNQPPDEPNINGPTQVKVGDTNTYTIVAIDPENDNILYEVDWGDGIVDEWYGPVESNVVIQSSHKWEQKGDFKIKVRAKDIHGAIGNWSSLIVTAPCSYNIPMHWFWEKILERFPNTFPIIRHLIGY